MAAIKRKETVCGRFGELLAVMFIALKLTHQIDWSWWWILSPLWGAVVLAVVIGVLRTSAGK